MRTSVNAQFDKLHIQPCTPHRTNRVAAVLIGALIIGMFVFLRVVDLKVVNPAWTPYLHLTTWTHFIVGAYFLLVGFTNRQYQSLTAAIGYLAMFVFIMRLLYFEYEMTNFFASFKELFAHVLVPVAMISWIAARQIEFPLQDNSWRWKSVLWFLLLVTVWFIINCIIRNKRGVWIYGENAADPATSEGKVQIIAGVIVVSLCIALVQLFVTHSCYGATVSVSSSKKSDSSD